jgi:transcriptional regulator with XRE-family HTH domain
MAPQMYLGHARRQRPNATPLAMLLRRARLSLGLNQRTILKHLKVSDRTLTRWEAGEMRPTKELRERVSIIYGNVDGETWRAIVAELKLPLDAMLEKVPQQRAKLPQPPAPEPPPIVESPPAPPAETTPPTPTTKEIRARMDDIVRAAAEELDVTARRLRAALGNVLADIDAMSISPSEARAHVLQRGARG